MKAISILLYLICFLSSVISWGFENADDEGHVNQEELFRIEAYCKVATKSSLRISMRSRHIDSFLSDELQKNIYEKLLLQELMCNYPEDRDTILHELDTFKTTCERVLKNDSIAIYDFFNSNFSWYPWQKKLSHLKRELEPLLCNDGIPFQIDPHSVHAYDIAFTIKNFFEGLLNEDSIKKWIDSKAHDIASFKYLANNDLPSNYYYDHSKRYLKKLFFAPSIEKKYSIYTHQLTKDIAAIKRSIAEGSIEKASQIYFQYKSNENRSHGAHSAEKISRTIFSKALDTQQAYLYSKNSADPYSREVREKYDHTNSLEDKAEIIKKSIPVFEQRNKAQRRLLEQITDSPEKISKNAHDMIYKLIDVEDNPSEICERLATLSSDDSDLEVQKSYALFHTPEGLPKIGNFDRTLLDGIAMPHTLGEQCLTQHRVLVGKLCAIKPDLEHYSIARKHALVCVKKSCTNELHKRDYFDIACAVQVALEYPYADQTVLDCQSLLQLAAYHEQGVYIDEFACYIKSLRDPDLSVDERARQQQLLRMLEINLYYNQEKRSLFIPYDTMQKRLKAFQAKKSEDFSVTTKNYALSDLFKKRLEGHKIDFKKYEHCTGTFLQQSLHSESIAILEELNSYHDKVVTELVIDFSEIGYIYNRGALYDKTCVALDVCWSILRCTGEAATRGVVAGLYNTAKLTLQTVTNPKQAAFDLAKSITDAGSAIAEFTKRHPLEAMIVLLYIARVPTLIGPMAVLSALNSRDLIFALHKCSVDIKNYLSEHPYQLIESTSTLATECFLQARIIGVLGKLFSLASVEISRKLEQARKGMVLLTSEEVPAAIAVETGERFFLNQPKDILNVAEDLVQNIDQINAADFLINKSYVAILKNGYYEVNGFKFTEYYYNRLWEKGRKAPSLIAKEILDNATSQLPDRIPGFFRYEFEKWEMIYNPSTKEVYHLAPIKKCKVQ